MTAFPPVYEYVCIYIYGILFSTATIDFICNCDGKEPTIKVDHSRDDP